MKKKNFLKTPVRHIDITSFDATPIIEAMQGMSFTARDLAAAAGIYDRMLAEKRCGIILTIAGSTSAAGCMQIYVEMVKNNMVDAIVATGATVVDMDFFEALGFRHYQGTPFVDDRVLRSLYIDRIYDTYIDENELQICDKTIQTVADGLSPRPHSSREFIREMGRYLTENAVKKDSLVQAAFEHGVPIFCPAFSDSSAGFGLVLHQVKHPKAHVSIDSVKDFLELTQIKIKAGETGLLMIGGGTPKNFAQDTVVCAEVLGKDGPDAQVRRPDHGGRRPRRGLLQLHAQGGQLLGEGGQQLRADGLCGGHLRPSAPGKLRLAPGELEEAQTVAFCEALCGRIVQRWPCGVFGGVKTIAFSSAGAGRRKGSMNIKKGIGASFSQSVRPLFPYWWR